MIIEFFLIFAQGAQSAGNRLVQQITDPPLTWHALYWAITLGLSGVTFRLYKDLRQENKEKIELLERVLTAFDNNTDALRAIDKRLAEEAADKEVVKRLVAIEQSLSKK